MTAPARTVFLGSGAFAIPVVEAVSRSPSVDLVTIVTAPPRPSGRGGRIQPSVVGGWAEANAVPMLTPSRLRDPEAVLAVAALRPELLVLADYGRIVPPELLDLPRFGALNLHPSLLPRHRGATPIPAAILAGDAETGVTLMQMDAGLDTGPVVAQWQVPLTGEETALELEERLARVAADLVTEFLPRWLRRDLPVMPQLEEGATLTRPLRREDSRLDPGRPAAELARQVRAYQPWPGSALETDVGRLVVWRAAPGPPRPDAPIGQLVTAGEGLALVTGEGTLELLEVQPAGGRRMTGSELVRGRRGLVGNRVTPSG